MGEPSRVPPARLSVDTASAVRLGQDRARATQSVADQTRCDDALDELLRKPDAIGDPEVLLRHAIANARKKARRRQSIAAIVSIEDAETLRDLAPPDGVAAAEALDILARAPLTPSERALLAFAVAELSATDIALRLGVSSRSAEQRLSRARRRAREAGLRSVVAA